MGGYRKQRPPKRKSTGLLGQSHSQLLPDISFESEGQSHTQLSADSSFASTVSSFPSTDTASTDDTDITEPIEDGAVMEPMQINQSGCNKETPVQLEVELTDEAGGATVQMRIVPADQVARAQRIIAGAEGAEEAEQNRAIEEATQLLYPYPPREGQRDALRQLIYKRKDLIPTQRPRSHRLSGIITPGQAQLLSSYHAYGLTSSHTSLQPISKPGMMTTRDACLVPLK